MDDFSQGPYSFDLIISSLDPKITSTSNNSIIKVDLSRPLAFSSGSWEVGVKQLIFTPLFGNIKSDLKNRTIYYLESETQTEPKTLRLNVPEEYPDTIPKIAKFFNEEVPLSLRSKLAVKVDLEKNLIFETKGLQFSVESPYLAWLFGLNTDLYYPYIFSAEKVDIKSSFKPYIRGICPYFKITTDFTTPVYCGTHYEQIILTDVLPKTTGLTNLNYDSPIYSTIISSYLSSINLKILDIYNNSFELIDQRCPIIIRLHFRKKTEFLL